MHLSSLCSVLFLHGRIIVPKHIIMVADKAYVVKDATYSLNHTVLYSTVYPVVLLRVQIVIVSIHVGTSVLRF